MDKWPEAENYLHEHSAVKGSDELMDNFINAVGARLHGPEKDYIDTIKRLSGEEKKTGTAWLQSIVDQVVGEMKNKAGIYKT